MSITQSLEAVVDRIQHSAASSAVFGDPITADGTTIIPVARVRYGFGGGFGSAEGDVSTDEEGMEGPGGEGGGFGGGVDAAPVGVVEVSEGETRFVRFDSRRRLAVAFFGGLVVGGLLARRGTAEA